jgi:hypothetical protein
MSLTTLKEIRYVVLELAFDPVPVSEMTYTWNLYKKRR